MSLIKDFIDRLETNKPRIGVVGDSMIDEYYSISVNRLSPEFAIPVIKADSEIPDHSLPGGAANVCYQFSKLGIKSDLISLIDAKANGVFKTRGLNTSLCRRAGCPDFFKVPVKKRYYHGEQPFCRIDIEPHFYGIGESELRSEQHSLFGDYRFGSHAPHDVLILSDYNKGVFTTLESRQRWVNLDIPTIVDPKGEPVVGWKGCTVFKPNSEEAYRLSGETEWKKQVGYFLDKAGCESVVITRGGSGVVGWDGRIGDFFEYVNGKKVSPQSVIGAGDCFGAFLAISYCLGFSMRECAEISFKAGAAYVRNMHNHPISTYDLLKNEDPIAAKYLSPVVGEGETVVFAGGCYDILHSGHLGLLEFAKSKGTKLVVGLNSDESVKRLKGDSRPIHSLSERMRAVAALGCVDFVCHFHEDNPSSLISRIKPDYLVKGSDYKDKEIVEAGLVKEVFLYDYVDGLSTTNIVEKIRNG